MDEQAADVIKVEPTKEDTPTDPLTVPMGEVFKKELAKLEGKEEEPAKKAEKAPSKAAKEPETAKGEDIPAKVEKTAKKPTSALDVALGAKLEEKKEPEPEVEPEILKEFPKDAKKPNWERAREVMGKQAKQLAERDKAEAELKRQLDEVKAQTGKLDPEIEKKLKENEELRDAITAVNLELLPEFRKEFVDGRKELVKEASAKLQAYGGDPQLLADALGMAEGRRRDEAIEAAFGEDMTEVGKTKIRGLIAKIEEKDEAKNKMLSDPQNSFESYQARQTERQSKAKQEAKIARDTEIADVIISLPGLSPFLKPADPSMPDAKEWNADFETIPTQVRKSLGSDATLKDSAILAAKGHRFDFVEKLLIATYGKLQTAEKQLAEYDTAQPEAKGNDGPKKTGAEAELEKSPGQIYRETMGLANANPVDA